jgi:uncharacterized protein
LILNIIGITVSSFFILLFVAILLSFVNVVLLKGKSKSLLRVSLSVLDFFHLQIKMLLKKILPKFNFDQVMIEARNKLNEDKFEKTKKRIFLTPHCLRSISCPAISTQYGVQCTLCGLCQFEKIKSEAEKNGYSIFILAGSSFIKKLIEETKPDGILLLGCSYEINKVMMALNGRTTYGITLLKDGCVNTIADINKIYSVLRLGIKEKHQEKSDYVD